MKLQEEEPLSKTKNVYLLQGEQIDYYWADIAEGLKDCPGYYDYYTPEWTLEEIKTGRLLVWALSNGQIRGIVMTRILILPKQKIFEILSIYGIDMLEFFNEMEDVFMKIAQRYGCETITARCRPGLQKFLKGFHAESTAVVMRRTIPKMGEQ